MREVGFSEIFIEKKSVPWRFSSQEEATSFVHTIHNATCSPAESFTVARTILGFEEVGDHFELGWELFFLTARKPMK